MTPQKPTREEMLLRSVELLKWVVDTGYGHRLVKAARVFLSEYAEMEKGHCNRCGAEGGTVVPGYRGPCECGGQVVDKPEPPKLIEHRFKPDYQAPPDYCFQAVGVEGGCTMKPCGQPESAHVKEREGR